MFKVGDKVKLNDKGAAKAWAFLSKDLVYIVSEVGAYTITLSGIGGVSYDNSDFKLAEEKEMKKIKFDINPSIKESKETFPCVREGKTTGRLYYFVNSYASGYPLHEDGSVTSFENTKPWTGKVTITQG